MRSVVVLGASGMLGSMVTDVFARDPDLRVRATGRRADYLEPATNRVPEAEWSILDVDDASDRALLRVLRGADWVVNAVGVIKPHIRDDDERERERAVRVNAWFPHRLARVCESAGALIVQIATDCVFSGTRGAYTERDPHDAHDVYGKTKSLGEVPAANMHHLRCSIVGPEPVAHVSLLDWFLAQPRGGEVHGYTNHLWNGITTLHFARLSRGLIRETTPTVRVQHVVPADCVTKADLLLEFANAFGRTDTTVAPITAETVIDRTLATVNPDENRRLWKTAGYDEPPSISQMVRELAGFDFRLSGVAG